MTRELTTDMAVLTRLAEPSGRDVLDVGCGGGELARAMAAEGARVTGLEISEQQLASARAAGDGSGVSYVVGFAQDLPLEDASVDVVVLMRSLHHVAPSELERSLQEFRRVLRPGGLVYVAEPMMEGDFFELTNIVDDEREVRTAAQLALARAERAGLDRVQTVEYAVRLSIDGIAGLRSRIVSVDPGRAEIFDAHGEELAEAFGRLGEAGERPGERCFVQPMRVDLLRPAAASGGRPTR